MPVTSYESRQDQLKRMLAQAQALRSQGQAQPKGEMVGGHFVAPHWSQQLAPAVNQIMGGVNEYMAGNQQKELEQEMGQEQQRWMGQRPMAKTLQLQGPQPEGVEGPLTGEVEPTTDDQIAWAGKGLQNPLTKALAQKHLEDQIIQEPIREEARRFKAGESAETRQARAELETQKGTQRLAELQLKFAEAGKDRSQRKAIADQIDATKRVISTQQATSRVSAAEAKATASGAKVKPVPNSITTDLSEAESVAQGTANAYTTYKPEYGGVEGLVDAISGKWNPWASKESEEAANWWADYENQVALVERHAKFGATLNEGEKAAWRAATITKGQSPATIQANLAMRAKLTAIFYNKLRERQVQLGYPQIGEAFQPVPESFEAIPGQTPAAINPAPPVLQPTGTPPKRRSSDVPATLPSGWSKG
jgi:hypothetical protein